MAVPYTFSTATGSLPLSQLDSNFSTAITIGNTAVVLGDTITNINNLSLANVAITSVSTAFPNGYLANSNVIVGTTTLTLGSTVTAINGLSLSNVTISSGNVTISNVTTTNVTATTANVTTANIGTLVVIGDATVGGNTTVTGNITAAKGTFTSANVTGTANVQVIAVTQNATVAGNATVTGNVSAAKGTFTSANVSGTANVQIIAVTQNATVAGNATITGNVSAANGSFTSSNITGISNVTTLAVVANATVGGNVSITGNVSAANGTFTSANVSGTANVSTLAVISNVTIGGNVTVTGNVSMNVATITTANVSGTANVSTLVVTANQTSLGNISVTGNVTASSFTSTSTFGFKNRIINGAMVISQRNGTSATTVNGNDIYTLDRFKGWASGGGVFTVTQSSTAPTGFTYSSLITVTTADASIAASDNYRFAQVIEGYNIADLGFGTASASTVTLSFWVRSSITGTFGGSLYSVNGTRSYVFNYTISAANTWEQKTVTIAGDTSGTWGTTNSYGITVYFDLGSGSNYENATGSWVAAEKFRTSGNATLISTLSNTWYVTGVQLEKGSTATSFDYRPYGTELNLCQRYCQYAGSGASGSFDGSTTVIQIMEKCVVTMRAAPSGAIYSGVTAAFRSVALDFTAASPALANFLANSSNIGGTSFWTQVSGFTGGTSNAVVTARNNQAANGGNFILLTSEL